jgi:NAD(P)-dependent dehydrogenase (short-subunit alcohol dehydrogenase family)
MSILKTWFITGVAAASGANWPRRFSLVATVSLAHCAMKHSRSPSPALNPSLARGVLLDVTDEGAVQRVVEETVSHYGPIDVLVNNAGYGLEGAIEETSLAQARHQFEVNFFGALALIKAVLPGMRKQRSGHVVNITSVGGLLAFPGVGIYNASKHALEGLTDSLTQEVAHLGIRVTAVEPGPFRTDWAGRSMIHVGNRIDDYLPSAGAMREALAQRNGKQAGDPVKAAAAIIRVTAADSPPRRLVLGVSGFKHVGENLGARQAELARWADISLGADFPVG